MLALIFIMLFATVAAENTTVNETLNVTLNVSLNTTLQNTTDTSTNTSVSTNTSGNATFIFDVLLESAEFIERNGTSSINITGVITSALDTGDAIFSAVEIDGYTYNDANRSNHTDFTVCTYYINGTETFSCSITNGSYFTLISMTEFENETLYRYADFSYDDVLTELIETPENTTMPRTEEVSEFSVVFEEIYTNGTITGIIHLNTTLEDNEVLVDVWSVNATNRTEEQQSCNFVMNSSLAFTCPVTFMTSGTYAINVSVIADTLYNAFEITYFEAPEFVLRTEHEGVYTVGDIITIDAYGLLNNRNIDTDIVLTVEAGNFTLNSTTGDLEFVALDPGTYAVSAQTTFRGMNYSRNSSLEILPTTSFLETWEETLTVELNDVYEENKEILVPMNVSHSKSTSIRTHIILPDNSTFEYISEISNGKSEIAFLPAEEGEYLVDININNTDTGLFRAITVLNTTNYVKEAVLKPVLNRTDISSRIEIEDVVFRNDSEEYDIKFNVSATSRAVLRGIKSLDTITYIQSPDTNDSSVTTEIFAIDNVNITTAELTLAKNRDVEYIMHCEDWNETSATCGMWTSTTIPFVENATHVVFNVTHFTAYAGGGGNNSRLGIWDTVDIDKEHTVAYVGELVNFTANYTDNTTGVAIGTATCSIEFNNDGTEYGMVYDVGQGIYWYNRSFTTNGLNTYLVNCTDGSYDDLVAEDNVSILSIANISEGTQTRENLTVGYTTALSCRVIDGNNATPLDQYNVSYYSDVEGYLGSQTTDVLGWSSVLFEPAENGTHTITCNITSDDESYYNASVSNEHVLIVNAAYSEMNLEKKMTYNGSQSYNITLTLANDGLYRLDDVTIADFVPDGFTPILSEPVSTWNESAHMKVPGRIFYWNISTVPGQSSIVFNYTLISDGTTTIHDIKNSYIIGQTYHLN
jgi:hypothetical protein